MSAPSKVNKENFRLLDLSSDEESEDLQLEIIPSRKKKITRFVIRFHHISLALDLYYLHIISKHLHNLS